MNERLTPLIQTLEIGLISLGLSACVSVPKNAEAYYNPFTDEIKYLDNDIDPKTIIHEETHKKRANEYPGGRILWGLRYDLDRGFACAEETEANKEALITLTHPACEGLEK